MTTSTLPWEPGVRSSTRSPQGRSRREASRTRPDVGTGRPRRDAAIDNVRFILIVLVVIGHILTTMRADATVDSVYSWIYLFHMPAFVLLAGLVVQRDVVDPHQGSRIVSTLVAPLIVFGALYQAATWALGFEGPAQDTLMDPYWILWFLVALAMWRLSVPVLRALRWPVMTTLALATALVALTDLPPILSLDRFIVLMPFFAAGLSLTPERLTAIRTLPWRLAAAAVLASTALLAGWATRLPAGCTTFADGVGVDGPSRLAGLPAFLAVYLLAAAMIAALLALTPTGRSRVSVWGSRTMYVYLLHGFVILAFRATALDSWGVSWTSWVLIVLSAVGLTIALASDRVVRSTRPLVEPDVRWALREPRRP